MRDRSLLAAVLSIGLVMPFIGCSAPKGLDAIQVTPPSSSVTIGQTTQFTATGLFGNAAHLSSRDITSQVTWSSASNSVAQVAATGLVTAVGNGTTTITASAKGYNGPVSSSATVSVSGGSGFGGPVSSTSLISLTIIPSAITVGGLEDTGNFLAIGTYSVAPQVRDVTNQVVWTSSFPTFSPSIPIPAGVGATAGIVTAYGSGTGATIMAEVTDPVTKSIQFATAQFSCPYVAPCPCSVEQGCSTPVTTCPNGPVAGSCFPGSGSPALLSTVTVYNEGLDTSNWYVTAPSATGTPNVIHCGPGWTLNGGTGGSVCVATYPVGTPFVLTAPAGAGAFGGWSSNCTPVVSPSNLTPTNITANGPNYCELDPTTTSETVGAVFN